MRRHLTLSQYAETLFFTQYNGSSKRFTIPNIPEQGKKLAFSSSQMTPLYVRLT